MMASGDRIAAAAAALVGTPFRLHGRDPRTGIDCAGLVILALAEAGQPVPPIPPYRLRNADYGFVARLVSDAGLVPARSPFLPGDIVLARPGPAQRHLLIGLGRGRFVHAHAGLGRVVQTPAWPGWPIAASWRTQQE